MEHCQVTRAVPQCDCRRDRPLVQAWTQGTLQQRQAQTGE
jgi:hypothetical protein